LATSSAALEPIELPLLEEMPDPDAIENAIEFQSFVTESAFLKSAEAPLTLPPTEPLNPPAPVKLLGTSERESS
jgi:hypothetical protein